MQPYDRLGTVREAACLAHTIPGVTLHVGVASNHTLLVSYLCLGADLTPCQLRSALIVGRTHDLRPLTDAIRGAEIASGLIDLGGGLYQRLHDGADERWFTSTLEPHLLAEELRACPDAGPFEVVIKPDVDLGVSAVRVAAAAGTPPHDAGDLDTTAWRVLCACIVAELIHSVDPARR